MVHRINLGKSRFSAAFTLIELMIVLLLIALLASAVMPTVVGSINDAKESALKENLKVVRDAIDDYYADHARYPSSLEALVEERYLRKIPTDPMAQENEEWEITYDNDGDSRGVIDIHSSSNATSSQQTPYNQW